ncbi:hypothetical protein [Streptomyces adelaidensis]|uniref:hypothetical protein n=1 Tax=Streptomyces adelaidensis TaxID=2796465 RepID=UPI001904028A|nr:hypothetical protein [Streptomyces adelaidensis]
MSRTAPDIPTGTLVRDLATDRVGILRDVLDPGDPYGVHPKDGTGRLAFLAPSGGGVEWTTRPEQVVRQQPDQTDVT